MSKALTGSLPDFQAAQAYLCSHKGRGLKKGLERMRPFAAVLGHPERAVPCIHVTGTNGKGSTAAMLESILRAEGWRMGLYTSPHLVHLGERVQVNRQPLTEAELLGFTRELFPFADCLAQGGPDDHPAFFEFMTAMAFLHFMRSGCDISVIEVGMGGEWDATNIVTPEVSVITSISLDHCETLGASVEAIARTKAGIIKQGKPVVIGRMPSEAESVIRAIAFERGAPLASVREVFGDQLGGYPKTNLEGDYQRWNAATATLAARSLPHRLRPQERNIENGLLAVSWQGRWQRIDLGNLQLVLDASHNPEGAQVLDQNLAKLTEETGRRPIVIVGVLGSTRAAPLLKTIARHAGAIHLVVPNEPRACSHEELLRLMPADYAGIVHSTSVASLFPVPGVCSVGGPGNPVVVTGSIYLAGEVLARIGQGA